jgi:hypothetical protein
VAPYVLLNSKLWVDGIDMSGYKNRIALSSPRALKEHTRFGDSGIRRAGGLRETTLRSQGFWDTATGFGGTLYEPDKPYADDVGVVDVPVSVAPETGVEGSIGFLFRSAVARYELGAQVGDMLAFSVDASASDGVGLVRAQVLANKDVAAGGPTNGTAFQVGAIAAGQSAYAALHVLAVGTSLDVKIQRDTVGFPSAVDAITFAQATAIGSQFATLAGPQTDDYWRIVFSNVGAPNAKFVVLFGIR